MIISNCREPGLTADLPLSSSVVCSGLLDLPVVGEVRLVAHQDEGDVVVVLHPQYLISELLQDTQTYKPIGQVGSVHLR